MRTKMPSNFSSNQNMAENVAASQDIHRNVRHKHDILAHCLGNVVDRSNKTILLNRVAIH